MPCGVNSSGVGWTQSLYTQINRYENGTSSTSTSGPWDVAVDISESRGQCLSNYFQRVRRGELLPLTNWLQYAIRGNETGSYTMTYDPPGSGNRVSLVIAPYGSYGNRTDLNPTYWYASLADAHKFMSTNVKAYVQAAAADIYTSAGHDSLTFLAELGKTKQMLVQSARSMLKLASRPGFKPSSEFRKVPGKWLETRYGWRPLIYDLEDLNKAVSTLTANKGIQRLRESKGTSDGGSDTTSWTFSSASTKVGIMELTTSYDVSVRGTVVADIKPPSFRFNPFATAWELVPYSFVMDWVVDVGQYIEAMAFLTIAQQYYAAGGYKFTVRRELRRYPQELNPYHSGYYYSIGQCTCEGVVRFPTTVAYTPSIQLKLNAFKVVDLLALVKQRLGFRR